MRTGERSDWKCPPSRLDPRDFAARFTAAWCRGNEAEYRRPLEGISTIAEPMPKARCRSSRQASYIKKSPRISEHALFHYACSTRKRYRCLKRGNGSGWAARPHVPQPPRDPPKRRDRLRRSFTSRQCPRLRSAICARLQIAALPLRRLPRQPRPWFRWRCSEPPDTSERCRWRRTRSR